MSDQPQCLCIPFEVFNLLPPPPFIQHIVLHSYLQQMEALMVSAFSGAMGSLLAKLGALLEKDFKLAKDAKKEIISLRDEMSSINAFLMKLSAMEEPVDVQLRELRSKVRELAYDMEDCVDIFMHNLGSNKKGLLHGLKMLRARYETATLIKTLKARAVGIGNWYELMTRLPGWPRTVWVDPRIQALYTDAAILQGIDDPKEKLVKLLKEDGACRLKVVSIVGFGGIGKTTLAKQVYTTIQGQYDCTAFVSMSRNPDLAKILSDIIKQFVGWFYSSLDDEKQLIEEFRDCLQDKRYFVVIDDIWTIEEWNIIKCCFVENNRGSRVITTTRIEDTAEACCSSFHGHLRYLRTRGIGCNNLLPYLQKLEELKTLEVVTEGGYFVLDAGMLPSTLWHLIIPVGVVLAGRVGQMRSLRTLCKLPIDLKDAERMKELGELTNLRELVLFRSSYGVEDTCDVLLASLCKLCNLRSLIIRGSLEQDVLSHWLPPPHRLRRLHALECLFSTVPAGWITQLSNLHSLEIQVVSLLSDGIDILARLISLVHLKLHIQEHSPQDSTLVVRHAAFPNLWEFCFRCKTPCLMFEAGTMPRIRSLDIECYEQGARQANSVLDGIEHLGTLEEFKVHIYARESFIPMEFCCGDAMKSHEEKHRKWDRKSLEVAITEAISKHPRSFRVVIETVEWTRKVRIGILRDHVLLAALMFNFLNRDDIGHDYYAPCRDYSEWR
ncbi:hypothetical protein PR202_gb02936 [Eleusine coracana subsp. coracana]|uniref:Uncharacterized protein n=1 Tax=Eleusine coracana subsp. coracana TaxID=191504 RepID=A0AAV5E0E4_ELECO|nr:hypothetical protein PR202_gb02936 [Eleusine coracana subsp. coracana]